MRKLTEKEVVLATHNKGKVAELQALLEPYGITVLCSDDLGLSEPEETGKTFVENAKIKAVTAAFEAERPAIADDSGLCVHALNGRPGIYSARYNEPKKNGFAYAMEKLNEELGDSTDRSAHFASAVVLAWPDGTVNVFEGRVDGTLCWPPRGEKGFGYDPMFVPDGYDKTFAELPADVKNSISHRARATTALVKACL